MLPSRKLAKSISSSARGQRYRPLDALAQGSNGLAAQRRIDSRRRAQEAQSRIESRQRARDTQRRIDPCQRTEQTSAHSPDGSEHQALAGAQLEDSKVSRTVDKPLHDHGLRIHKHDILVHKFKVSPKKIYYTSRKTLSARTFGQLVSIVREDNVDDDLVDWKPPLVVSPHPRAEHGSQIGPALEEYLKRLEDRNGTEEEIVSRLLESDKDLADMEDVDEWDTISALEQNRRDLDWREQLKEPEDWDYESSLDSIGDGQRSPEQLKEAEHWECRSDLENTGNKQKPRFIEQYATDLELWEALYQYRFKTYGMDGAKMIWRHLNWAVAKQPMRVWERPRLWKGLMQAAFDDDRILKDLISHCTRMAAVFDDKPDHFYSDVMTHIFAVNFSLAPAFHQALQPTFQPEMDELRTLFAHLCEVPEALRSFKSFCFELQTFTDMYDFVLDKLTKRRMFEEAVDWHESLHKRGYRPSRASTVVPLLSHLQDQNNSAAVHRIASQLHHSGVPGVQPWLGDGSGSLEPKQQSDGDSGTARNETSLLTEPNFHNLPEKHFSDAFVARLIATSFFAATTILNGLSAISVTEIGPLAFRELILRLASSNYSEANVPVMPFHVREAQSLLETSQMSLSVSSFSGLIKQLAEDDSAEVLQSILSSDQHPEVLDDVVLQESLLERYIEQGAYNDIRRTLAILTFTRGQNYSTARLDDVCNLQIMHSVLHLDKSAALAAVEGVIRFHGRLSSQAVSGVLYELMFSPRRVGFLPSTFVEIDEVTAYMKRLQQLGYAVPMKAWIELIRRQMWLVDLAQIEEILTWLYNWVNSARFRQANTLPDAKPVDWGYRYIAWSNLMKHGEWYTDALFNLRMQKNLIQVGFTADYRKRQKAILSRTAEVLTGSHEEKVRVLLEDESLWGLRLMKQFRDMGVRFETDDVRRACAANLAVLFSPRLQARAIHRQMQMGRKANWVDYAAAMEQIWGEQLFMPDFVWDNDKEALCRVPSASPTRLQDYCEETLRRAALRSRLMLRGWWMTPEGIAEMKYTTGKYYRFWMRGLPFADTDDFFKQLVPEMNPGGKLQYDPLLDLTEAEIRNLTRYNLGKNRGVEVEGYVKRGNWSSDLNFQPQVLQPKHRPGKWR